MSEEKDKIKNKLMKNLGGNFTLMIDPNNSYDLKKSLDIGEVLDANDFYWFEKPLKWKEEKSNKKLATNLKTPLSIKIFLTWFDITVIPSR